MRILNVTQSYAPFFEFGGPPVKVRALAEGLARRGHQVTVLTADWGIDQRLRESKGEPPAQPSPFGKTRIVNGVAAIYLPTWFQFRTATWNPALGRYLQARLGEFDVTHIFGLYDFLGPRVAAECRKRKIPYIVEPIGMFVPIVRNIRMKQLYHHLWGSEMLDGASALIATAEQEQDELIAGGITPEKIRLRRNGVDVPDCLPSRGRFRAALKIPESAKLILFLGRLSRKKSPDLLLKAFAGLQDFTYLGGEGPRLAFVGPDEAGMKAQLEASADACGVTKRVHVLGPLDGSAKWEAYRDADIFVLPSQNENFGNTAAEAVAAGTPVIVTDRCGVAPLLKGVAGLVVRHDENDLRAALSRLLQDGDLWKRLHEGCARAAAAMGWEEPLRKMEIIYSALASRDET
jgi:glycosyltransferase involved in cell wall biosynthesis